MVALSNRIAVVTGASGGIGKAIALGLGTAGASLCLVGRRRDRLDEIAERARASSPRVTTQQVDLTIDEQVEEFAATLQRDFGRIDVLVHSAGVISVGALEHATVDDLDWQYRVNVRAPYRLTQALLSMIRRSQGQIVFINSLAGIHAKAGSSQYSMTKHALRAMADGLREEVNEDGVRVLSVFLGRAATSMQASVRRMESKPYAPELLIDPDDVARLTVTALSLSRTAEVTEVHIRHAIKLP